MTDAQLQRVFDSGMDPAAMVKAGWWDRTVVYRWSAEEVPEGESGGSEESSVYSANTPDDEQVVESET